nr:hypothetical protein [bacterium]
NHREQTIIADAIAALGPAWMHGGVSLAEGIRRKTAAMERLAMPTRKRAGARLTMELAGSLHISRADARELIEESETSTSEECYARARSALRAYAGSGFECHVQNPLDAALKRIVEAESERDALSADLAESEATLEPLRLALGEHIGRIEALVRRAPPVPTNAKREDDEYEDVCATPDVIGELRRHGHDDTADLVESLVGIGPRPFAYSDPVADFEHQRRCTEDARIVAIVREWGGGGHELPSRLRNNGDYTTAALVEALRGVIGGSDA